MQFNVNPLKPPKAKAAVFVPAPAGQVLAVLKAPPAVQVLPLYVSVQDTLENGAAALLPPKAKAADCVPVPPSRYLAVDKVAAAVHTPMGRVGVGVGVAVLVGVTVNVVVVVGVGVAV